MFSSKCLNAALLAAEGLAVAVLIGTAGCGDGGYSAPSAEVAEETPAKATNSEPGNSEPGNSEPAEASPPPVQTERVVAETGVGIKGRSLESGIMTSSAKALFRTRERLVFIQVEHAMNLFRATNGNFPKSHDEFMAKIIVENKLELPELPAGAKYVYDPAKGELMVERPRHDASNGRR